MSESTARLLLSFLERFESEAINWGYFDLWTEVEDLVYAVKDRGVPELRDALAVIDTDDIIEELTHSGQVIRDSRDNRRIRSRFAEGIRLIAQLRQRFNQKDWLGAPKLVGSLRVLLQQRSYPRRDLTPEQAFGGVDLSRVGQACLAALTDGGRMRFGGFQARSFRRLMAKEDRPRNATVIAAGTGSGKTKAFYIPALIRISEGIAKGISQRVVAIYPRNILLIDQIREAIGEVGRLNKALHNQGCRMISMGALFGEVPHRDDIEAAQRTKMCKGWKRTEEGWRVPFAMDPVGNEAGELIWRHEDLAAGRHRLCRRGGEEVVPTGVFRLSREEICKAPPDILFVSSEMLNRCLAHPKEWGKVFGDWTTPAPSLVLLDEVHTYEGITGAQVAWTLRRWAFWARATKVDRGMHFVGLSATLGNAEAFMAQLTGIPAPYVEVCQPKPEEMEYEGMEYCIGIKADATSGASTLSTTLQVGMVLPRLMAPFDGPDAERQRSYLGRKVFGFTDRLDGAHRWATQMEDVERQALAKLRAPSEIKASELVVRDSVGEVWASLEGFGHPLDARLRMDLLTSRTESSTINRVAQLVIATSALEVGYDDREVGAILHHKRALSLASFLQRKGRAGRDRRTRPWTVLVLSDYGADRWCYQNLESWFGGVAPDIHLPVANIFVIRSQATRWVAEWLCRRCGVPLDALIAPRLDRLKESNPFIDSCRNRVATVIRSILSGAGDDHRKLVNGMRQFIGSIIEYGPETDEERERLVNEILWREPRPILLDALPRMLRRLETGWVEQPDGDGLEAPMAPRVPFPESVPEQLFNSTSGARVSLHRGEEILEEMGPGQALVEACPGKASLRNVPGVGDRALWCAADTMGDAIDLGVMGSGWMQVGETDGIPILQPTALAVVPTPNEVRVESSGDWVWGSAVYDRGSTPVCELSFGASPVLVRSHLHVRNQAIEVVRYGMAIEVQRSTQLPKRGVERKRMRCERFEHRGQPVRPGFRVSCDGIVLAVDEQNSSRFIDAAEVRAEVFRDALRRDVDLRGRVDSFQIDRIADVTMGSIAATVVVDGGDAATASETVGDNRVRLAQQIFEGIDVQHPGDEGRVWRELKAALEDVTVIGAISRHQSVLWAGGDDERVVEWERRVWRSTVAHGLIAGSGSILPDLCEDSLVIDLRDRTGGFDAVLSEVGEGGLGIVQSLVAAIRGDPERFGEAVEERMKSCDRERRHGILAAVAASLLQHDDPCGERILALRHAVQSGDRIAVKSARTELVKTLAIAGHAPSAEDITLVIRRYGHMPLHPDLDALSARVLKERSMIETRAGFGLEDSIAASIIARGDLGSDLIGLVSGAVGGVLPPDRVVALVRQILIPTCRHSCPSCLIDGDRYRQLERPSRVVARHRIGSGMTVVSTDEVGWESDLVSSLAEDGVVEVSAPVGEGGRVARTVATIAAAGVAAGSYRCDAWVDGFRRSNGRDMVRVCRDGSDD